MKVTDILTSGQSPTVSFELFPPRSEKAAVNLEKAINNLAALKPDFVSVTFGAGGSNREGSCQLINKLKNEIITNLFFCSFDFFFYFYFFFFFFFF